jgi:hypothetical protein
VNVALLERDFREPTLVDRSQSALIVGCALGSALAGGLLAAVAGPVAVLAVAGVGVFVLVAWRPVLATYLYLATLPFIAGIGRGTFLPLLRPNEALLVLLIAGVLVGGYVRVVQGVPLQLRIGSLDLALAAFVLLATVWPISSMLLRGMTPVPTDLAAVLPMCKLAGLLVLVRSTVRTPNQVLACIRFIIGGALGIAALAVVQSLKIGPLPGFLAVWYPAWPEELDRATTTLSNPIATGDYVLIGLIVLITARVRGLIGQRTAAAAGLLLVAGMLAAGQFSTLLGAVFVGALLIRLLPRASVFVLRVAPLLAIAIVVGSPALFSRLAKFEGGGFPPQSWRVRWDNVAHLYLPELLGSGRYLIGVSPNTVKVPPDTWRKVIYLESGYLQFLWIGGVPLLVCFIVLSRVVIRTARGLSAGTDGVAACGSALLIAWWTLVVLSVLDAHLYLRGPGDLLFVLLGIVAGNAIEMRTDDGT